MASILFPAHCCGCADYSVDATMLQHEVPLPNLRRKKLDHNRITAEVADNVQPRLRSGLRANQRRTRLDPPGPKTVSCPVTSRGSVSTRFPFTCTRHAA